MNTVKGALKELARGQNADELLAIRSDCFTKANKLLRKIYSFDLPPQARATMILDSRKMLSARS